MTMSIINDGQSTMTMSVNGWDSRNGTIQVIREDSLLTMIVNNGEDTVTALKVTIDWVKNITKRPHSDRFLGLVDHYRNFKNQSENMNDSSEHFHEELSGSVGNRKRHHKRKRKSEEQASNSV